jgi:hypothetical protein
MRIIPTRIHGLIDYLVGAVLILLPFLAGYPLDSAAALVPIFLGAGTIVVSLFTDYELSIRRLIPMPTHLGVDMASGILLAISPLLFGFSERAWVPHAVLGLFEVATALMTETVSGTVGLRRESSAVRH